jgi:rhodanese-related sulfurtransferase
VSARAGGPGAAPTIDAYLAEVRSTYERLEPLAAAVAVEHGALLIDIRPLPQRIHEGTVPGTIDIERNVLEWRLAPSSAHRIAEMTDPRLTVIIMCSEGYASSFAAATLRTLGVDATDLTGGFHAWKAAGLPTADLRKPGSAHLCAV